MTDDTPRRADGAKLCAWCGSEIQQSGVGRSRDYCRRSCRQRAYEQRRIDEITTANARLIRHELTRQFQASAISSRDSSPEPHDSSRDEIRRPSIPSRDETRPAAGPAPVPAQAADASPPSPSKAAPSRPGRRRLLPPPPGTHRSGSEEVQPPLLGFGFGAPPVRKDADGE
ncbi:MAG: hypothetical protein HOV82_00895 [Streptomyces sp.]|nr:hypothetical protein [Streptomyces sp.]NUR66961.1 hypothetical protein [Streptomyces sp.]NUS75919.1 hypothetical protein [Streptomyces sp.]